MTDTEPAGDRIAKMIARAGICSRRDAEKLIAEGRVTLDGEKVTTPAIKVGPHQVVAVDGKPLCRARAHAAVALSQAGRAGDHAPRHARPADRLRQPAQDHAARGFGRAAGCELRRPAAAHQ